MTRTIITLVAAVALVLGLAGCASLPADAEAAVRDCIAIDAGHMRDEGLPQEARDIAQDNHDVLWDLLYRCGAVDELPADVRARKDARAGGGGQ